MLHRNPIAAWLAPRCERDMSVTGRSLAGYDTESSRGRRRG
jgi:hypothetical protein